MIEVKEREVVESRFKMNRIKTKPHAMKAAIAIARALNASAKSMARKKMIMA